LILRDRDTDGNGTLDERLYATMDYFNGTAVLNASGTILERYAYAAFGERRIMAADFSPRSTSSYAWDFGFQGQFRDGETGWYNYGYRFYVPLLGRWINRDPIEEEGGLSLYGFVEGNPINATDDFGHRPGVPYRHNDQIPGMGGGGGGGGGLRPIRIPNIPKPSPRPGSAPAPNPGRSPHSSSGGSPTKMPDPRDRPVQLPPIIPESSSTPKSRENDPWCRATRPEPDHAPLAESCGNCYYRCSDGTEYGVSARHQGKDLLSCPSPLRKSTILSEAEKIWTI
jgi:RHS repeat-associated protein